ncbi:MAG: BON domain-containing protein [Verrucomicrobiales bacterium]|nr:BON domain-containing protein [Verrucomicrobiales bacterium]
MKGCFTTLLLALIAAFIAAFFGRSCHQQRVEDVLNERVASKIKATYPGVDVKYDHLTAMVSGKASPREVDEIKEKVKELAFGNGRVHFDITPTVAPIEPRAKMPNFTISRDSNKLILSGMVDSAQTKAILGKEAPGALGDLEIENNLEIGSNTAPFPAFGAAVTAIPELMKAASDGRVEANTEQVIVSGTVENQSVKDQLLSYFASDKWNNAEIVDRIKLKPAPARTVPPSFTVVRANNKLTLTGQVDSEESKLQIGNAAKVEGLTVDNQIEVSNTVMEFPPLSSIVAGIPSLINSAENGKIDVSPNEITLSGLVADRPVKDGVLGFFSGDNWSGPPVVDQLKVKPSLPPGFTIQRNNEKLVLTGNVDSQRTKDMLGNSARLEGVTIDNQIKVNDQVMAFPEFNSLLSGINGLIGSAKNGKIEASPEKVVLSGMVDSRKSKDDVLGYYSGDTWKGPKIEERLKVKPSIKPNFAVQRQDDKLTLTGLVDSPATKTKLGNAAKVEGLTVDNQIKVNEEVMTFPQIDSTISGIPALINAASNGKIEVTPDKVVLSGRVGDQAAKDGLLGMYSGLDWKGPKIEDKIEVGAMPTKPPAFTIARDNKKLTLSGVVDSDETKVKLGNAAKMEGVTVDNQLKVSPDVKTFPAMKETVAGIPSLVSAAANGKIDVTPEKVTLSGLVNNEKDKNGIVGNFAANDWKGPKLDVQIKVRPPKIAPTFAWKQSETKKAELSGKVPNAKVRDSIIAAAKKRLGDDAEITDKMEIDSNVKNEPWLSALPVFATQALPKVENPIINIDNEKSSISGAVSNSTIMNDVSLAFSGINPPGKLDVNLSVVKPVVPKPAMKPSRTIVPDLEITGKKDRLVVAGKVPNQKTHDMIVNTILGVNDIDHLDKKLKIGDDVKEENYLEPLPDFIGKFYSGSIKEREVWLKNKELTLRGIVPSQDAKAKAVALADPLKKRGVKIIDLLDVKPPAPPKMAVVDTPPAPPKMDPPTPKPDKPKAVEKDPAPMTKAPDKIKAAQPVNPDKGEVHSVYFGTGEFHIRDSQKTRARKLLSRAKETTGKIIIDGFADERGSNELNEFLSDERANRIRMYLISNGIDQKRIVSVVGRGEVPNGEYQEYRRTDVRIVE